MLGTLGQSLRLGNYLVEHESKVDCHVKPYCLSIKLAMRMGWPVDLVGLSDPSLPNNACNLQQASAVQVSCEQPETSITNNSEHKFVQIVLML